MSNRRVVITGTGLITALGTGVEKNWQALLAGKSGRRPDHPFDAEQASTRAFAGEVKDFDAEEFIDKREVRRMDLFTQYALAAAEMAMKESGLPIGTDKPHGYDAGAGGRHRRLAASAASARSRSSTRRRWRRASTGCRPFFILQMIINMAPGPDHHHATAPRARTGRRCRPAPPRRTPSARRAKSIRCGETDAMIAGGAEAAITPLGIGGFAAMKALSTRNDDPAHASRPSTRTATAS